MWDMYHQAVESKVQKLKVCYEKKKGRNFFTRTMQTKSLKRGVNLNTLGTLGLVETRSRFCFYAWFTVFYPSKNELKLFVFKLDIP